MVTELLCISVFLVASSCNLCLFIVKFHENMRLIFKTKLLIYQSKVNIYEEILFGKITHHLDSEIRKMLVKGAFRNEDSTFNSGRRIICY